MCKCTRFYLCSYCEQQNLAKMPEAIIFTPKQSQVYSLATYRIAKSYGLDKQEAIELCEINGEGGMITHLKNIEQLKIDHMLRKNRGEAS